MPGAKERIATLVSSISSPTAQNNLDWINLCQRSLQNGPPEIPRPLHR